MINPKFVHTSNVGHRSLKKLLTVLCPLEAGSICKKLSKVPDPLAVFSQVSGFPVNLGVHQHPIMRAGLAALLKSIGKTGVFHDTVALAETVDGYVGTVFDGIGDGLDELIIHNYTQIHDTTNIPRLAESWSIAVQSGGKKLIIQTVPVFAATMSTLWQMPAEVVWDYYG